MHLNNVHQAHFAGVRRFDGAGIGLILLALIRFIADGPADPGAEQPADHGSGLRVPGGRADGRSYARPEGGAMVEQPLPASASRPAVRIRSREMFGWFMASCLSSSGSLCRGTSGSSTGFQFSSRLEINSIKYSMTVIP
jgi:hypothetical protein